MTANEEPTASSATDTMMATKQPRHSVRPRHLILTIVLPLIGGCTHINLTQFAYEMLRQEDCKQNRLEDFCTRTFAHEYLEYERLRQDFLRSQTQREWRVEQDPTTLQESPTLN